MARKSDASQVARQLLEAFNKLPWKGKVAVVVAVLAVGGGLYALSRSQFGSREEPPPSEPPPDASQLVNVPPPAVEFPRGSTDVTFCVWNMENLFDDRDDPYTRTPDREYDDWFAHNAADRMRKYDSLAEWLVEQNGGRGPDVIVGIEIESYRTAELLRDALNAKLPAGVSPYQHVAMEEIDAGRHIAPCVVSRYPIDQVRQPDRQRRILEFRLTVNGHPLTVVAAHWTSQLSDDGKNTARDKGRRGYATTIHAAYAEAIRADPNVDYLVCGDWNDPPEADSVYKDLHVMGDSRLVTPNANPPRLFGLLSGLSPKEYGTHYYSGEGELIYDHIAVSPGMFDAQGWGYVRDSVQVPTDGLIRFGTRGRRPWRFGNANDDALGRGYADHFPVTVTLKVAP